MKKILAILAVILLVPLTASAQDFCEGNFDYDDDVDGADAFIFKKDFGRSKFQNPCLPRSCNEELEARVAYLEKLLANITRNENDITFSGINVHIVDGSETTDGEINGLGNLIIGYNELRGSGDERTGSHNIVVGTELNYSSYGGLVVGQRNTISGTYASVSGGSDNFASGDGASVSGGTGNVARDDYSSVSGGTYNLADGLGASVSGGHSNTARGLSASVSGGVINKAAGDYASVSGGTDNLASGSSSSVSGGVENTASAWGTIVSGGGLNLASGYLSSVSGGGYDNIASGYLASVSGGDGNKASGFGSSVSGGLDNEAFANYSSIQGGHDNFTGDPSLMDHTIDQFSSISGGNAQSTSSNYECICP